MQLFIFLSVKVLTSQLFHPAVFNPVKKVWTLSFVIRDTNHSSCC